MIRRFDAAALYEAMDAERRERGLTWKQVAEETSVNVSTITRTRQGGRMEVDGMLNLVAPNEMLRTAGRSFGGDAAG